MIYASSCFLIHPAITQIHLQFKYRFRILDWMYKRVGCCRFDPTVSYSLCSKYCFVPVEIVVNKMRLALSVLVCFIATYAASEKRQLFHNYLPYYGPNMVEHQRLFWPTTTVAILKMSTLTYTITCTKSTTACSSSSTTSTTPSSSTTSSSTTTSSSSSSTTTSSTTTGRRRRENIEIENEDWANEQFSITPSNVQG